MANLTVALNGIPVGVLERSRSGAMAFHYLRSWLERPGARALSLSLPLSPSRYQGAVVYNFFDNLLPDSSVIRARIQTRFRSPSQHPFDLLSSIGRDCIGAVQLYPETTSIPDVRAVSATPLSEADVASLLTHYQEPHFQLTEADDCRISLAGAQEKTALLWYRNQWCLPFGSTPTSHIFKLPIGFLGNSSIDLRQSSENEWLCLRIVKAFGVPAANAELAQFGDQSVLIVERFDRRWSGDDSWLMRLPQEDFCQSLGVAPALKYESDGGPGIADCMRLLLGSQAPTQDREMFFKSQMVFWLLAAIDGHAKNFSVFLEPGSAYRMTPLYDVISAHPLITQGSLPAERARMAMSLKGQNRHYHWARIQPRHFISSARAVGFSAERTLQIIDDLARTTSEVVDAVNAELPAGFPNHISDSIFNGLITQAGKLREYVESS
ncbi:MAG: serine/threonine protein kinase [Marinobacter sp. 34-60-7]|nr:MAG: serine/threonine protein kinase [Marinobacter sp. 34-60-7]